MTEYEDYILVKNDLQDDHFLIKLLSTEYKDVCYSYGSIKITEEEHNNETYGKLSFVYNVESGNQQYSKDQLAADSTFQQIIGKVLESIINNNEFRIGKDESKN